MNNTPSGIYRHYKGKLYKVVTIADHTETSEQYVVYCSLEGAEKGRWWVRPQAMFSEEIEIDGVRKKRFEFVQEEL